MDHLSFLSDHNILIFLLQLLAVLILSRILSLPLRRLKIPAFPAELLAGIVLGPTVLGRLAPIWHHALFPPDLLQHHMLETIGWIGILFVLLVTGMQVRLSSAWLQRRQLGRTGILLTAFSLAAGIVPALLLPAEFFSASPESLLPTRLLIALALGIVALPVSLRIMNSMGILRSDFGVLAAASLSMADIAGWTGLTVILATIEKADDGLWVLVRSVLLLLVLLSLSIAGGRILAQRLPSAWRDRLQTWTGEGMGLMILCGLAVGSITIAIGVHALFGFFLAGILLGESRLIKEETRSKTEAMMESVFVPVFFAGLGLRLDFAANFDVGLFLLFAVGALVLRFGVGYLTARLGKLPSPQQFLYSVLNLSGGELQVVIALIAMEARLIQPPLFVALLSSAVVSPLAAAAMATIALRRQRERSLLDFLPATGIIHDLQAPQRDHAFRELAEQAAIYLERPASAVLGLIHEREAMASTALGRSLAFPHLRLEGLDQALVIPARSIRGIEDWDSLDGKAIHLVFLIVTPQNHPEIQLEILRHLVQIFSRETVREQALQAESEEAFYRQIRNALLPASIPLPGGKQARRP